MGIVHELCIPIGVALLAHGTVQIPKDLHEEAIVRGRPFVLLQAFEKIQERFQDGDPFLVGPEGAREVSADQLVGSALVPCRDTAPQSLVGTHSSIVAGVAEEAVSACEESLGKDFRGRSSFEGLEPGFEPAAEDGGDADHAHHQVIGFSIVEHGTSFREKCDYAFAYGISLE